METKYVRVPFEVELAKKIQNKECDGRIITEGGKIVRIVCWDRKYLNYPIIALIDNAERGEGFGFYTEYGVTTYCNDELELMLEIPEYMTFKDGDVIVCDKSVLLFSGDVNQYDLCGCYCSLFGDTESLDLNFDYKGVFPETRLATESEKQKLIDALKTSKEPKAKEYLKRFFGIEEKKECKFTFKQDVLVRQNNKDLWCGAQFSHKELNHYVVFGGSYFFQCIPYNEQTAHLLGTTDNYE